MTNFKEIKGDLFISDECLAHCVSKDLKMGAGIALQFNKKYGKDTLIEQKKNIGEVAILITPDKKFIYYMITKECYFHKPTYESLTSCLIEIRKHMITNKMNKLSIPKIGCGLDKLNWDKVKNIIIEVMKDIQVTVYYID